MVDMASIAPILYDIAHLASTGSLPLVHADGPVFPR